MRCVTFLLFVFLLSGAEAVSPGWWTATDTRILDTSSQPSNYSPVNLGQLKFVAKKAKTHLDIALAGVGGAGAEIDQLVTSFIASTVDNYAVANIGQLKAVAKPFYKRLRSVGFDTRQNLILHGYPTEWTLDYPWISTTPTIENYAPANLGQLKMVFSFDAAKDTDSDGIPDVLDPDADNDGDGTLNGQETASGRDPGKRDNPALQLSATGFVVP